MSITYDWVFTQFDTKPSYDGLSDVVSVVHWRLTAVDDTGISASNYGTANLGDPNPSQYVPFDQITKEMTIGWMDSCMDVPALKENLAQQIANIKNPPIVPMTPPFDLNT